MQSTEPDIAAATVALLLREKLLQAEVLANQLTTFLLVIILYYPAL